MKNESVQIEMMEVSKQHHHYNENLQQELMQLNEWKNKAKVQLEYFRMACNLYNLCDTNTLNDLLMN